MKVSVVEDTQDCRKIWNAFFRPRSVSDLWGFRDCFHREFDRGLWFLLLEDGRGTAAVAPLVRGRHAGEFLLFPGETWKGRTWLERTPLYARDQACLEHLFSCCPEGTRLRYLDLPDPGVTEGIEPDEVGYVLYPGAFRFRLEAYLSRFSSKRRKAISRTIRDLTGGKPRWVMNRLEDFDLLVRMNLDRFGKESYLYRPGFRNSFRNALHYLHEEGLLRLVSLVIGDEIVAVDMGAVFNGVYTVFMGGTDPRFPGVAKVMNMHHIRYAFENALFKVDFLCGDFHWKKLWHLDPEPLYQFSRLERQAERSLEDAQARQPASGRLSA